MIEHMVWIKFREGVSPDRAEWHMDALRQLKGKVPAIEQVYAGANVTDRSQGYTHGLLVRLETRDALQQYLEHPEHRAVSGPLKEDAELMVMDIEHF